MEVIFPRSVAILSGTSYVYEVHNVTGQVSNNAIYAYFLVSHWNLRHSALLAVLGNMLHERAFAQLRTNEQLGYIVFAGQRTAQGASGIVFIVQSSVKVLRFVFFLRLLKFVGPSIPR